MSSSLQSGLAYSRAGLRLCERNPRPLLTLVALFVWPALLPLVLTLSPLAELLLTSLTVVGGGMTLIVAVDSLARGERLGLAALLLRALRLLPRYLLTNLQTTIVFWSVMLPLLTVVTRVADGRPPLVGFVLWALVIAFGLTWHLQTLFAPYLALCGGLSPIDAVLQGFRMLHGRRATTMATFLTAGAFAGLPSLLVVLALHEIASREGAAAVARFDHALPYLTTAVVQLIRPVLTASVHRLYEDLRLAHQPALREAL